MVLLKDKTLKKFCSFKFQKNELIQTLFAHAQECIFYFQKCFPWLQPCWGLGLPLNHGKFILQSPYPYYHSPWKIRKPCMIYIFCNFVYKRKRCKVIKLQVNTLLETVQKKRVLIIQDQSQGIETIKGYQKS